MQVSQDPHTIKLGWDGPLDVDWDFQLPLLRREIQRAAPGRGGALKAAFDSPDTVTINRDETVITIEVGKHHRAWPYAAIQNFGGPERDIIIRPRFAKALRFWWMGRLRFFSKVTMHAGQILGSHYIERAVFNWWEVLKRGIVREPVVQWRSKHYAAPMTRGRGIRSR